MKRAFLATAAAFFLFTTAAMAQVEQPSQINFQATGLVTLMVGMVMSTTGGSLGPPAIQAMAIDRSRPERRGAAMATFSLSFQLGSFVGGIVGGFLIDALGYSPYYAAMALPACFALALLISHWRSLATPARLEPAA